MEYKLSDQQTIVRLIFQQYSSTFIKSKNKQQSFASSMILIFQLFLISFLRRFSLLFNQSRFYHYWLFGNQQNFGNKFKIKIFTLQTDFCLYLILLTEINSYFDQFLFNNILQLKIHKQDHNAKQLMNITQQLQSAANEIYQFQLDDYCASGSWGFSIVANLALGTFIYVLSIITTEYSWVDRIWSILPIVYQAHILYYQHHCQHIAIADRQYVMFALTIIWGSRLTYNFWRKGGYAKGGEDYRWVYIRQKYPKILAELLNFVFTSYYQIFLIYLFSSPIKNSYHEDFNYRDAIIVTVWITLFIGEVIADQQQWNFQTKKYSYLNKGQKINQIPYPYNIGFIKSGLFSISRHPNFFCQISLWWTMFAFSLNSVGFNMTGLGAILLNLLFLGSTSLTETISSEKYQKYKDYQKETSRLVPFLIIGAQTPKDKAN